MTIRKNFVFLLSTAQGETYKTRKALTAAAARASLTYEYPEAHYIELQVRGKKTRDDNPIFPYRAERFGEYVYRHKGKAKKGRKAYPAQRHYFKQIIVPWAGPFEEPVQRYLDSWAAVVLRNKSVVEVLS